MAERRELAAHAASVHLIREKLLQELANVGPPSRHQRALVLLDKSGELANVRRVGADSQLGQAFLDSQIVEKTTEDGRVGLGKRHGPC